MCARVDVSLFGGERALQHGAALPRIDAEPAARRGRALLLAARARGRARSSSCCRTAGRRVPARLRPSPPSIISAYRMAAIASPTSEANRRCSIDELDRRRRQGVHGRRPFQRAAAAPKLAPFGRPESRTGAFTHGRSDAVRTDRRSATCGSRTASWSRRCTSIPAVKGFATDWHLMNAGRYAAGGAGLVIMESTKVERRGCGTVGDLGLWDDAFIPGPEALRRLHQGAQRRARASSSAIPAARRGASARGKAARRSSPHPRSADWDAWELVAPSALAAPETDPMPRALTRDEIPDVIERFGQGGAARRMRPASR